MEKSFYPSKAIFKAIETAKRVSITDREGFFLMTRLVTCRIEFILTFREMLDEAIKLGLQSKAGKKKRHQAVRFGLRTGTLAVRKGKYPALMFGKKWVKKSDFVDAPLWECEVKRRG